jgi:uncharacterized integral membrane protein (TIGR00698 family)
VTEPKRLLPGLLVAAALATVAFFAGDTPFVKDSLHMSPLLLVILLGMLWRLIACLPAALEPGIVMAQKPILRWAVAGLGFRLSLLELWKIGGPGLAVVLVSTLAALWFGWWLARAVGLEEKLGLLLGVGSSICGASAVVAADSVVQGEKKDSAYALGIITLLGTLGIVVYPLIYSVTGMSKQMYALWNGASLHEMAQVVAAADMVQGTTADATVVKLARICLLAPVVFYLAWSLKAHRRAAGEPHVAPVPWFLIVFLLVVAFNSTGVLPPETVKLLQRIDLWLLCVGMVGVGLQTSFRELRTAGAKPLLVGAGQWVFLATLSMGLAYLVTLL